MAFNLADLNGSNGFRLDGEAAGNLSGESVSNAGDVNGDGYDDLIVGAPGGNSSYVIFGKASGFDAAIDLSDLDGNIGFRLNGDANYHSSGSSVSTAGDINGDGFDDLMVSAYGRDPGVSYVVFGKSSGFDATINLSDLDGSDGFRLDTKDLASYVVDLSTDSVSAAGDINGDGFDDLIVGDPDGGTISVNDRYNIYYSSHHGAGYVVFGKASGFDAVMDLSNLDGNDGFRLNGTKSGHYTGESVSNAGDVNGDGFDDVIIGAPGVSTYKNGITNNGASYVVFGKASGFDATMDLSDLDGNNGFRIDGKAEGDHSGVSVSTAGDVNGDGFDDLIIGSSEAGPKDNYGDSLGYGASYVVFGKASGFDATMDLADLNGSNGFRLGGVAEDDHSGYSVSSAGDVNGDGFDDLIVGAFGADPNGVYSGSSYLVFGKASGFANAMNLSTLDGSKGLRLDGENQNDKSGVSVSAAGDVNNDGFDDLIMGATGADPNGENSGSSYVVFGRADFSGIEVISGTSGRDNLIGTSAAERFEAGNGNDRMTGNGGADEFYGGLGNDNIRVRDLNFELADGGKGYDILSLANKNLHLDLTTSAGDKISGIEAIYLYGNGNNTLTLDKAAVLDASNTTNTLKVLGNSGDKIFGLSSGWNDGGIHNGEHVFTNGNATLLVGVQVTTDFA
jgi:hypothetical protein